MDNMHNMRNLLAVTLGLALIGCASSSPRIDAARLGELRKGQTTVNEVVSQFGRPSVISRNMDGTQTAAYVHTDGGSGAASMVPLIGALAGSTDANVDSVIFYFDAKGMLTDYKKTTRTAAGGQTAKTAPGQSAQPDTDKTAKVTSGSAPAQSGANKPPETSTGLRTILNLPSLLPSATKDMRNGTD